MAYATGELPLALTKTLCRQKGEIVGQAIRYIRLPLCITDPALPDNPIVFANDAFSELTGYELDEVIGRNCKFLQGPDTTEESRARIREILETQDHGAVEIVNYRKDGTRFLNALHLSPIVGDDGRVMLYFGTQHDISEQRRREHEAARLKAQEIIHRLRNVVNVMAVTIRLTGREYPGTEALQGKIIGRLRALSEAHFSTLSGFDDAEPCNIRELLENVLGVYVEDCARAFSLTGPDLVLPENHIGPVTLALHELATNAVKYGALSTPQGRVALGWARRAGRLELDWTERDGPPVTPPETPPAHTGPARTGGSDIIGRIMAAAGGDLDLQWEADGLKARIVLPLPQ